MEHYANRLAYSRRASEDEIKSSLYKVPFNSGKPLFGGIPLFSDSEAVYVDGDDAHSIVIGSTGSKKTRLIGMPALRTYAAAGESFIATDPKAELCMMFYTMIFFPRLQLPSNRRFGAIGRRKALQ